MRKLLRPKDLLLLGLANLLDIYEEVRDPFGIAANSYQQIYGWVPRRFKRHNFTQLLSRQLKTGNIEKIEKNGEVYLRITSKGEEETVRDFPLFTLKKRKWDNRWRVVVFDIAETSKRGRERLREKLKELGLGMFQKSVWISPHDIILDFKEFIQSQGLEDFVYAMEVSHLLAGDPRELANKIWKLEELNDSYHEVFLALEKLKRSYIISGDRSILSRHKSTKVSSTKVRQILRKRLENKFSDLKGRYLEILLSDPFLPNELLPTDWYQEKVLRLIKSIKF